MFLSDSISIPVVLLILAVIRPIRPLTAIWVSLAVFSSNFVLGPLGNRLAGSRSDIEFNPRFEMLWPMLLIGFVAAALVGGVCALRIRRADPTLHDREFKKLIGQEQAPITDSTFTTARERLAALHSEGKLSDDKFRPAKKRLLSAH